MNPPNGNLLLGGFNLNNTLLEYEIKKHLSIVF